MSTILGLIIIGVLIGAFAAVLGYVLFHAVPQLSTRMRRTIAPLLCSALVLSPAFLAAGKVGLGAVLQVTVMAGVLAMIFGYPMVRLFEPKPREKD